MYKKIKIEHFRGISKLELKDLKRFNLFVGKNNCGKTSILESIFLLSGPTNVDLPVMINNFRGYHLMDDYSWTLIFNKLNTGSSIRLSGETIKPKEKRELTIKPLTGSVVTGNGGNGSAHFTIKESRTIPQERINGLSLEYKLNKNGKKEDESLVSEIRWVDGKPDRRYSRKHSESIRGIFINPMTTMEDTAQRFNEVQIRKQENNILKILQKVEPELIDLSIGAENILYCDVGFEKRLPFNAVGEGLNRLLATILAIYDASGGVLFIDEIENGLHYSAQEILWEAIFTAAETFNVQLFATTHSFENIKAFSSAYDKSSTQSDDLRLYRLEKEKEELHLIDFNRDVLKTAIESEWEIR